MMRALLVSRTPGGGPEVFFSVQGEGVSVGEPAVFLRLALCNLACAWCDTRYTWDWASHDRARETVGVLPADLVPLLLGHGCRRLVVTGGEPLLQRRQLVPLLEDLKGRGFTVEVETNGTLLPGDLDRLVDQWNVSPKLASSGNARRRREVQRCYAFFRGSGSSYFKFVVQDEADLAEACSLVRRYGLDPGRVFLMPQARDVPGLQARGRWLVEACKAHGYRFSCRLHVLLWGDERGR